MIGVMIGAALRDQQGKRHGVDNPAMSHQVCDVLQQGAGPARQHAEEDGDDRAAHQQRRPAALGPVEPPGKNRGEALQQHRRVRQKAEQPGEAPERRFEQQAEAGDDDAVGCVDYEPGMVEHPGQNGGKVGTRSIGSGER